LLPWYKNIDERFSTKNIESFTCSANMGAIVFEPPQDDVDAGEKTPAMLEYEDALENGVCLNTSLAGK